MGSVLRPHLTIRKVPILGILFDNVDDDPLISEDTSYAIKKWDEGMSHSDESLITTIKEYSRLHKMKLLFILACAVAIILSISVSVTLGSYDIDFLKVYELIWQHMMGTVSPEDTTADYVVWTLRLPRIIMAIFGGASLAVAGAVLQSILKNPLADSYTTGVSSGAGFGAVLAMSLGIAGAAMTGVVTLAFVFAMIPTAIIILISRFSNASPTTMVMAGLGTMYIFNAFTTVIMLWSDPQALSRMYSWQVGSLGLATWDGVPIVMVISMAGVILTAFLSGRLNVLATGDESAKALGIDAAKLRMMFLILTGILAASIVSFIGLVAFVGLVSPHICRMFVGADNKYLIPATAIFGGMLMLLADQVGQILLSTPLPVGVVMSFLGGPVFIWLILRRSANAW